MTFGNDWKSAKTSSLISIDDDEQFPPLSSLSLEKRKQPHMFINHIKKFNNKKKNIHSKNNVVCCLDELDDGRYTLVCGIDINIFGIDEFDENNNVNNKVCGIDEIDDNVLSSILSRLSAWKYLDALRWVCCRWYRLICDPLFIRSLPQNSQPFNLYFQSSLRTISTIYEHPTFKSKADPFGLDFLPSNCTYRVIASVNDILICRCDSINCPNLYLICNPLTNKYLEIVPPEVPDDHSSHWEDHAIGFSGTFEGNSRVKGEGGFRLVRVIVQEYPIPSVVQVFSSESGEWSSISCDFTDFKFCSTNSVTLGHKLHWLGYGIILAIDPFSNRILQHRLPTLMITNFGTESILLGVCQGKLRLAELKEWCNKSYSVNVWELQDYDACTWVKVKKLSGIIGKKLLRKGFSMFQKKKEHNTIKLDSNAMKVISFHPYDADVVYLAYNSKVNLVCWRCDFNEMTICVALRHHGSWCYPQARQFNNLL